MDAAAQMLEDALNAALARAETGEGPPLLAKAMRYSVFPGGARVRPKLCLAVAQANGAAAPEAAMAAAVAIELLHCASLVHDDLPCFDDASMRRGQLSVHRAFGEPIAVLTGDALIVLAFEGLSQARFSDPSQLPALVTIIAQSVGAPHGIAAGQAWESEPKTSLEHYHRSKTGALFIAAATAGAVAGGVDPKAWRGLGEHLGAAYQLADDLCDAFASVEESGKSNGRDAALGRICAIGELGVEGALAQLEQKIEAAVAAIPPCAGAEPLRDLVRLQAKRLVPKSLAQSAA